MKKLALVMALMIAIGTVVAAQQTPRTTAPVFEGKDTLFRPTNYREWIFVGSSRGLSYVQSANPQSQDTNATMEMYHNVYIKPESYREFAKTGKFPEGTVLVLEMASSGAKKEPALQGTFENEFIGLDVAVKDKSRFEGGWAYYSFSNGMTSSYRDKAQPFPASAGCVSCHKQNAATDNVFTQFYPVLRAVKPK
jgi:Cytochrome P460